jgi:hypothetical protein
MVSKKRTMKKIIHKLRNRPEEERRHILHIIVFVLALFMILLWTFSLGKSIANKDTKIKIQQDLKPFSVLKDNLVGGYESIKGTGSSNTNTQ